MCTRVRHARKLAWPLVCLILGTATFATSAPAGDVDADLLLHGGTIHDGSGAEPLVGDVAVRDGRIVAVGKLTPGKIGRIIECPGLVVAPGLIDLHTHTDGTLAQAGVRPSLNCLLQGCTTVCTGNCGGAKDVAEFLRDVDANGAGTNVLHLVGHGSIRQAVLGSQRRAPSAEELQRMKDLVEQAMREGAWGLSTGLIYAPGSFAQTDELAALAKVAAARGGLYVSHIRDEGDHLLSAVDEAIRIGRQSGAPVHISHFKSMQIPNWGRIREAAAMIDKARAQGLAITADQYPYTANSFSLADATLPDAQVRWSRSDLGKRMASEPEFAARVRRVIADQLARTEKIEIAASTAFPNYVGKSLKHIAAGERIDAVDLVLKILARESPQIVSHSMSEADVRWAMALPWVATASDGAARKQDPAEHHHPRNFGTFARKIGRYAIQDKVLSLPQAIRSATGLPADIFGIAERGYLRPGYHADIVVFDPATYRDRATFDKPQEYATGVRYVFLAGQPAVDEGRASDKLFGRALRHGSAARSQAAVRRIDPPEKGFYAKCLDYRGLPIKGAAEVSDAAFDEAWRRVHNLLDKNPVILDNLRRAGCEVHIIGKDQAQTDLPEFRRHKGVPLPENPRITLDERARGMGGRQCSCGEENLLRLPGDRYRGRDILSHEFTHAIHRYGLSANVQQQITAAYRSARDKKLWETPAGKPIYGGSNEDEYLAEMALWYVGGRGDWPRSMPPMKPGPEFLKSYDADGYRLVDDLFQGRLDVHPVEPRTRTRR